MQQQKFSFSVTGSVDVPVMGSVDVPVTGSVDVPFCDGISGCSFL